MVLGWSGADRDFDYDFGLGYALLVLFESPRSPHRPGRAYLLAADDHFNSFSFPLTETRRSGHENRLFAIPCITATFDSCIAVSCIMASARLSLTPVFLGSSM